MAGIIGNITKNTIQRNTNFIKTKINQNIIKRNLNYLFNKPDDIKNPQLFNIKNTYFNKLRYNPIYFNYLQKEIKLINDNPNKEYSKLDENSKIFFNILIDNINNKLLISYILLILSFSSFIYLNENKNNIIIKFPEDFSSINDNQILSVKKTNLKDIFLSVIERIKNINIELYNLLIKNFNLLLKIPDISYEYIKFIIDNINNIKDTDLLIEALNDFNILCKNIIISSSDKILVLINNFKIIINNYIKLSLNKLGEIAKQNLNIFLLLFKLPNINKEELLILFFNYIKKLQVELIFTKINEIIFFLNNIISKYDIEKLQNNLNKLVQNNNENSSINVNKKLNKIKIINYKNNKKTFNNLKSVKSNNNKSIINIQKIINLIINDYRKKSGNSKMFNYYIISKTFKNYKTKKLSVIKIKNFKNLITLNRIKNGRINT